MPSPKFQRTREDFICEYCGTKVSGNGYTNHCPCCLWSKHVDINPGDRAELCQGLMKLIGVELKGDIPVLLHKCTLCGVEGKNKIALGDDFQKVLEFILQ